MGQTSWIKKFQWLESTKVMNNDSYNANHNFSPGSTCLQNPVFDMAIAITHKQTVDVLISPAISSAFYTSHTSTKKKNLFTTKMYLLEISAGNNHISDF